MWQSEAPGQQIQHTGRPHRCHVTPRDAVRDRGLLSHDRPGGQDQAEYSEKSTVHARVPSGMCSRTYAMSRAAAIAARAESDRVLVGMCTETRVMMPIGTPPAGIHRLTRLAGHSRRTTYTLRQTVWQSGIQALIGLRASTAPRIASPRTGPGRKQAAASTSFQILSGDDAGRHKA